MYDIIGDIHGYAQSLKQLLEVMGYRNTNGVYSHPCRKAVFVGDFVDRGPEIIETLQIVKQMVDAGAALAIVGNHEFNVLCYYTKDKDGQPLREHNLKNRTQIKRTQEEFKADKNVKKYYLKWLRKLPLYLELEGFRVVHACWDMNSISLLKEINPENRLSKSFLRRVIDNQDKEYEALVMVLKGREFNLPEDMIIRDSYGFKRNSFRIKWWDTMEGESFQSLAFGNKFKLPAYTIPPQMCYPIIPYADNQPPVFFGHYCLNGMAGVVKPNICCVDACVANGGRLAAYRWDGEIHLDPEKMVFVEKE